MRIVRAYYGKSSGTFNFTSNYYNSNYSEYDIQEFKKYYSGAKPSSDTNEYWLCWWKNGYMDLKVFLEIGEKQSPFSCKKIKL